MSSKHTKRDEAPEEAAGAETVEAAARPKKLRYRMVRFVVFFAVLVLAMLTGYRYAINTEANMWYLFQVGRSTAWVLGVAFERGEVEPIRARSTAERQRAELARWRGDAPAGGEPVADGESTEPLTAWESWLHKAYSHIREGGSLENRGLTIHFLAKQGLVSRRRELRKELTSARDNEELEREARERKVAGLEAALEALAAEEAALPEGEAGDKARRDVQYTIEIIPDCGAIPSISIFLAAVIAFPTLIRHRVVGVVVGTVVLYAINVGRLATLMYIGAIDTKSGGKWFAFVHEYVWQGIFLVFVVAVWMAWIEFIVRSRRV